MPREGGSYLIDKKGGEPKLVHRTQPAQPQKQTTVAENTKADTKGEVADSENA
jgi:hypothetical protein